MKFTKNSSLVKSWVSLILAGIYTVEDVPELFNLKSVVQEIVSEIV